LEAQGTLPLTDADTTPTDPLDWTAIDQMIFAGESNISVMNRIREATGCCILEARRLSTDRYHFLRERHPEKFPQIHPDLIAAHARLLALLPNARQRIRVPSEITPDRILEAAEEAQAATESVLLPYSWRFSNPSGQGTKDFEDYGTLELFDEVFAKHPPLAGPVWLLIDGHPILLQDEQLREIIATERCDLTCDALFIWQLHPRISLIHHEGLFCHIMVPDCGDTAGVS